MGPSKDEIDGRIRETREHADENLGAAEQEAESDAVRYGKIAAVVVGAAAVAVAGVLIYRRMKRPERREQLRRMVVEALEDLPDTLRELPDELVRKIKQPLPSMNDVVNRETRDRMRDVLASVIRRVRD
jgi:hypothetical protein